MIGTLKVIYDIFDQFRDVDWWSAMDQCMCHIKLYIYIIYYIYICAMHEVFGAWCSYGVWCRYMLQTRLCKGPSV